MRRETKGEILLGAKFEIKNPTNINDCTFSISVANNINIREAHTLDMRLN